MLSWQKWQLLCRAAANRFTVSAVRSVAADVTELCLTPAAAAASFSALPGQFAYLRLADKTTMDREEHPFTIADVTDVSGELRFAIKASGDYTRRLAGLKPGGTAIVQGPYGRFGPNFFGAPQQLVMIAGGIGITPMLSVLRARQHKRLQYPCTLIWSNRTAAETPFRAELAAMQQQDPDLTVHLRFTREGDSRLDTDALRTLTPPYRPGTHAMLCGPGTMMRELAHALHELGYPRRAIHTERFFF